MTGLPAARVTDPTGGKVIKGSKTVFIGSEIEGEADAPSACEPAVGGPVNPILGVKLLPSETDVAIPAPLPFVFSRSYVSSNRQIGILGTGWSCSGDGLRIELESEATVLVDGQGRRLRFGALTPGASRFSPSEGLWLKRGGRFMVDESLPELRAADAEDALRWQGCPQAWLDDAEGYLLTRGSTHLYFAPTPAGLRIVGECSRFGYTTRYVWGALGVISEIHDSAGRCYALVYTRLADAIEGDHGLRLLGIVLANPHGPLPADFDPMAAGADWRVRYEYSAAGDLIGVRDRSGARIRSFVWDAQHRVIAHGQPGGREIRYVWDTEGPEGRVVEQIEVGGLQRRYVYGDDRTEVLDSLGRREIYEFRGEGAKRRWTAHQRADGSRIEYGYDAFGRRISMTDPLGRVTWYRREAQGRAVGASLPDGRTLSRELDVAGQLLAETGPEGRTVFKRDALGRLVELHTPGGGVERFAYTDLTLPDRITEHTDALGGVKHFGWNRLGQLTRHQDCSGQISQWRFDSDGQLIEATDALGQRSRYQYDARGLQTHIELPDGARIEQTFDGLGRLLAVTQNGTVLRRNVWNADSQLSESTDAAGRLLRFDYDAAGRLVTLHNENGATTRFAYDVADRMIEQIGFDGRTQRYRYCADDSLEWAEDSGLVHHYAYDDAGRMIEQRIQQGHDGPLLLTERLEWTASGQLAAAHSLGAEGGNSVRFDYDPAGRRVGEAQLQADGWSYRVQHQHGEDRQLASTYGELPALDWRYYGPGHLQSLDFGALQIEFERDPLHRETARHAWLQQGDTRRSAYTAIRDYDPLGRPRRQQLSTEHGERWQREYRFDALGRLTDIDDDAQGPIRYTYDLAGRLIGSRHGEEVFEYRFDPAGNRLPNAELSRPADEEWAATVQARLKDPRFNLLGEVDGEADTRVQRWTDNRVLFDEKHQYRYDAAGNLIERLGADGEHMQLHYDARHRLVRIQRRTAQGERIEARYHYDALSRRVRKDVTRNGHTETTRYGWDGDRLVAEEAATRLRTVVYEPGSFVPLLRVEQVRGVAEGSDAEASDEQSDALDGNELKSLRELLRSSGNPLPAELASSDDGLQIQFFHTDHLGTPLRMTDTAGREIWRARNDDWGAVRDEHGETEQPIRFQGQWEDAETALHYNRHRYYLSSAARFISKDPSGLPSGINEFSYVAISPITKVDPLGLFEVCGTYTHFNGETNYSFGLMSSIENKARGIMDWIKLSPKKPRGVTPIGRIKKAQDAYDGLVCAGDVDAESRREAAACDDQLSPILERHGIEPGSIRAGSTKVSEDKAREVVGEMMRTLNRTEEGRACAAHYEWGSIVDTAKERASRTNARGFFEWLSQ